MATLLDVVKRLLELSPSEMTFQGLEPRVEIGPQTPTEQMNTTVKRGLVTTYASARAVTKASQDKSSLLITFRPIFPFAVDRLSGLDLVRVRLLSKNYISSYVIGSGWLSARDGLNDALVEALGLKRTGNFETEGDYGELVAIGRVCVPPSVKNQSGFANYLAGRLDLPSVLFVGDLDDEVSSTLVSAGCYLDMPEIVKAKRAGITTIVTGELSPEIRLLANEEGINTFELGAFVTEDPGMKRLRDVLSLEFPDLGFDFLESGPLAQNLRPYKDDMA
jgi:putative NIF3 family GTP cyclohydrolase 1 type 2